jgi:hypothetical protein
MVPHPPFRGSRPPFAVALAGALLLAGGAGSAPLGARNALLNGEELSKGGTLTSFNGRYRMVFEESGKLAVYQLPESGAPPEVCWRTRAPGFEGPGTLVVQGDNNVVIYDGAGRPRWATGTWNRGRPGAACLVMQDNGDLCVCSGPRVLWSSGPYLGD